MSYLRETFIETGKHLFFTRIYRTVPEDSGREKIVLIHGLGMSGKYLHHLASRLSEKYTVYVPDLPGFGNSSKPAFVLNIQELADALHDWTQAFPVDKAWYLGNSAGCQIIIDFTFHYPARVQGLILQGPVIDPYQQSMGKQLLQFIKLMPYEPASVTLLMLIEYAKSGLRRLIETFRFSLQYKIRENLPHIMVPVLVVRGEFDKLVSQKWAEEATGLLPEGRLNVFAGEGHTIIYSAPGLMAQIVYEFTETEKIEKHESTLI